MAKLKHLTQNGITRRTYWIILVVSHITIILIAHYTSSENRISLLITQLALRLEFIFVNALRLINIGHHPIWSLLSLVPVANLLLTVVCAIRPASYTQTHRLDRTGQILAILIIALIILMIIKTFLF